MVVCVMYTLGDPTPILEAIQAGEYPILQIFHRAVGSNAGAILMYVIVLLMGLAATIGGYASASRMLWSFARDQGVPFPDWVITVCI